MQRSNGLDLHQAREALPRYAPSMSDKPLILVMDDDPDMRALLERLLSGAGYEVATAESAESARASVAKRRPALVLADINLPGASGIDFAAALRDDPQLARLPLIYVTAHEADEELALKTLGYPLLSKPVVPKELLALVKQQLRR